MLSGYVFWMHGNMFFKSVKCLNDVKVTKMLKSDRRYQADIFIMYDKLDFKLSTAQSSVRNKFREKPHATY